VLHPRPDPDLEHLRKRLFEPFVFSERLVGMRDTLPDLVAEGFPHFHLDGQTEMNALLPGGTKGRVTSGRNIPPRRCRARR
jgi:hypothetical protein